MMSTFEHKNSLRIIEAQIMQKLKNNEAPPKFTGSYKKNVYILGCPKRARHKTQNVITQMKAVDEDKFQLDKRIARIETI